MSTLIGFGWLSPRGPIPAKLQDLWPRAWDVRGRSALRKCMLLEMPRDLRDALPQEHVARPSLPPVRREVPAPIVPARRNPMKDVRVFPAISPEHVEHARRLAQQAQRPSMPTPSGWYEDPIALGSLLLLCPPVGLSVLWTSRRYSNDARWALTIMTGLTLCLGAAVVVAAFALRR